MRPLTFANALEERFWSPAGWPALPPECRAFQIVAHFDGVITPLGMLGSQNLQVGHPRTWKELKGTSWQPAKGIQDAWRVTFFLGDVPTGHRDHPSLASAYEEAKGHVMSDLFSKARASQGHAFVRFNRDRPVRIKLELAR